MISIICESLKKNKKRIRREEGGEEEGEEEGEKERRKQSTETLSCNHLGGTMISPDRIFSLIFCFLCVGIYWKATLFTTPRKRELLRLLDLGEE